MTPPGAVFVTEPLAAIFALEARDCFACHYVGESPSPRLMANIPCTGSRERQEATERLPRKPKAAKKSRPRTEISCSTS